MQRFPNLTCAAIPRLALARQLRAAHEKFVDRTRALAAFADRPHDQRLAAPRIAGREYLWHRCLVALGVGGDITPGIVFDAELVKHSFVHRVQLTRGEKYEIGLER